MGDFATLEALRSRVRDDLRHEAGHNAERDVRGQLMKALAGRVPFEPPPAPGVDLGTKLLYLTFAIAGAATIIAAAILFRSHH